MCRQWGDLLNDTLLTSVPATHGEASSSFTLLSVGRRGGCRKGTLCSCLLDALTALPSEPRSGAGAGW